MSELMTVEELEGYFAGIELPQRIVLVSGVVIEDVPLFLQSHFEYIHDNPTLKSIEAFKTRLRRCVEVLEAGNKESEKQEDK